MTLLMAFSWRAFVILAAAERSSVVVQRMRHTNLQSKLQHFPARGDAGTYPSHQRCCAASASHSGETQGEASPLHSTPPLRGLSNGSQIGVRKGSLCASTFSPRESSSS